MARRLNPEPAELVGTQAAADLTAVDLLPILLVDDRPENLQALEAVLEPLGYPLVAARSGAEALRLLLEQDFALILLDVRMPGLDGLETARLIKDRARNRDVPIVFLTAARDEVGDIIRGYGVGAVDYVQKPFDPEVLRSKVAVFAELEASRRALKRSEAFLRGAFEAAPIGKAVLDEERRIVRSNPAFARLVDADPQDLQGVAVTELCHPDDRPALLAALERLALEHAGAGRPDGAPLDIRLIPSPGRVVWVGLVASPIEPGEFAEPLLLAQWVDLTARRAAEDARAELLLEQAARAHAEELAERLRKLDGLSAALESLALGELLPALVDRLRDLFEVPVAEVEVGGELEENLTFRAQSDEAADFDRSDADLRIADWEEMPLAIERTRIGMLRLAVPYQRPFTAAGRSLLREAAGRAALSIRRAQLHEQEHRIAVELQRGLIPNTLPEVPGIELRGRYEAAGSLAEVGGDWYDAFELSGGRIGLVVGDVAGKGVRAASTMGQLRTVTRTFALADGGRRSTGEVLTRVNRSQVTSHGEVFTVIYAIIDPASGMLSWSSAGHPPPLVRTGEGASEYLAEGDAVVGIADVPYQTRRRQLAPGETLILYTDGLIERRGESLDAGMARLARAAAAGPADPEPLCDHILEQLVPGGQLDDDVTVLVARRSPR